MSAHTDWDVTEFFSEQLHRNGFDGSVVEETGHSLGIRFRVYKKSIDGETVFSTTVDIPAETRGHGERSLKSALVQQAEMVARQFEAQTTRVVTWGERRVGVSTYNGGWARCRKCDTRIEAPRVRYIRQYGKETSVAHPIEHQIGHERGNMSEYQLRLFELYMLGRLKHSCGCTPDRKI
jgi:hypothetical protein